MLTRQAAAEIVAADHDGVFGFVLVWFNEARGVRGRRSIRAYEPSFSYSARLEGTKVRYLAGMIWSVSMLSPTT